MAYNLVALIYLYRYQISLKLDKRKKELLVKKKFLWMNEHTTVRMDGKMA